MMDCHVSQFYEWMPYNQNKLDQVPEDPAERKKWTAEQWLPPMERDADRFRDLLKKLYGEERGAKVRYAEALEFGEYGGKIDESMFKRLFPFFD
jgi:hypothetical protein